MKNFEIRLSHIVNSQVLATVLLLLVLLLYFAKQFKGCCPVIAMWKNMTWNFHIIRILNKSLYKSSCFMFKFSTIKFNATDADMVNMINSVL